MRCRDANLHIRFILSDEHLSAVVIRQLNAGAVRSALAGIARGNDKPTERRVRRGDDVVGDVLRPRRDLSCVLFVPQLANAKGGIVLIRAGQAKPGGSSGNERGLN